MREGDVGHQTVAEKGADASAGTVVELIGNHEILRLQFLSQAANRARRHNPFDAERLHRVDVGAEVQLARQEPVAQAVPGQERDALPTQRRQDEGRGRLAKGRWDNALFAIGQLGHVVQTAAADDANSWCG